MKKLIAVLFLISIIFVVGCIQPPKMKTISELDESGEIVILEGTISYSHLGQIPFEGCYLNDGTGEIKLLGDKILVMETYPPQCQYEGKKVRITGTYINNCVRYEDGIDIVITGCYPYVNVTSIEVIGEATPEQACLDSGGEWKEFPNTCVDSCEYARSEEPLMCGMAMTYGCDCGPDKCWDGESCVANEENGSTELEFEIIKTGGTAYNYLLAPEDRGQDEWMQLDAAEVIINNQEEWETLYYNTLCANAEMGCSIDIPEVDFETETVIAVFRGAGGMCALETEFPGCFGIRSIEDAGTEYVVTVREYIPDEGCAVPTGIGSPYYFIKVDGVIKDTRTKPVLFDYQDVMVDCEDEEFCGWSTYVECSDDTDCITGGCSGQVCQHKDEEGLATTCEWLDCYDDVAYDMACKCINSQCQWGSLLDMI